MPFGLKETCRTGPRGRNSGGQTVSSRPSTCTLLSAETAPWEKSRLDPFSKRKRPSEGTATACPKGSSWGIKTALMLLLLSIYTVVWDCSGSATPPSQWLNSQFAAGVAWREATAFLEYLCWPASGTVEPSPCLVMLRTKLSVFLPPTHPLKVNVTVSKKM